MCGRHLGHCEGNFIWPIIVCSNCMFYYIIYHSDTECEEGIGTLCGELQLAHHYVL